MKTKRFLLGLIVLLLLAIAVGSPVQYRLCERLVKDRWVVYNELLTFQLRIDKNVEADSVIFFGDSFMQGLNVVAITSVGINFGIGRDSTDGLLGRFSQYSSITKARLVVVMVGYNDLTTKSNKRIIENLNKLIEMKPKGVPLLFHSIFPVGEARVDSKTINIRISSVNRALAVICALRSDLYFLGVSSSVVNAQGYLEQRYLLDDGLHLNREGNEVWIETLREKVLEILPRKTDEI